MNHLKVSLCIVCVLSIILMTGCSAMDRLTDNPTLKKEIIKLVSNRVLNPKGTPGPRMVQPANIFTDRMVLQRDAAIPLWGTAQPGEWVSAAIGNDYAVTQADSTGHWKLFLSKHKAGGPYKLVIRGDQGEPLILTDILIGDVFLCSGQSNMNMALQMCKGAPEEIKKSNYPQIRLLRAWTQMNYGPYDRLDLRPAGSWQYCSSSTTPNFSGVAYYFGRDLHKAKNIPIGIIQSSVGGTPIETWISRESLLKHEPLREKVKAMSNTPIDIKAAIDQYHLDTVKWMAAVNQYESSTLRYHEPGYDDSGWRADILPGVCPDLNSTDGSWWYRKTIAIPSSWVGQNLKLDLGPIDDMDDTWFNGVFVGGRNGASYFRSYVISSTLVKPGKNVIAVRVIDINFRGGLSGIPENLKLSCGTTESITLAGAWKSHSGTNLSQLPKLPINPFTYYRESGFYNGMIHPLVGLPIRGVLWYQGEANARRSAQYEELLRLWIADWRGKFGPVPFFIVQLPNYDTPTNVSTHEGWVQIMEAQAKVVSSTDSTALVVINDVGTLNNIHPTNKEPVGKRLALAAQKLIYGDKVVGYSPSFNSMTKEGSKLRISFKDLGSGLKVTDNGPIKGFEVCGVDGKYVPATAVLDKNTVVVSNPAIPDPQQVRFNWTDTPTVNLYNREGFPVAPFRTDNF